MKAALIPAGTELAWATVTASELVTSPDGRELVSLSVRYHDGREGRRVFGPGDDLPTLRASGTRIGMRDGRLAVVA